MSFSKKISLMGLILLFLSPAILAAEKKILSIHTWQTANNAHVYFVQAPQLPMLDIQVVFAGGSAYDGRDFGLANLVNSLLGEAAVGENADQIAAAFDEIGAQFATRATRDMATVSLRTLVAPDLLNKALAMYIKVLTQPNFQDTVALQRTKNLIAAEIKVGQQTPLTLAQDAFFKALYENLPYAHPVLGDIKQVMAYTPAQLQMFYQKFYVAKNANIILVGDITLQQAKQIAASISGPLQKGEAAFIDKPTSVKLQQNKKIQIVYPSSSTTVISGQIGITFNDKDYFPLIVGNAWLGGDDLDSLLFKRVRVQQGLAYMIQSIWAPLQYRGPFAIVFQTKVNAVPKAINIVNDTLDNFLKEKMTPSELNAVKKNLIGGFPLTLASNKNIVAALTVMAFYHQPLNYFDSYTHNISQVTAQDIEQAYQKKMAEEKKVTVIVGPQ